MFEEFFPDRQLLKIRGGEQYDVDQALADDATYLVSVILQRLEAAFRFVVSVRAGAVLQGAWSGDPEGHVGVLGIGNDEFLAAVGVGVDGVELRIKSLHTVLRVEEMRTGEARLWGKHPVHKVEMNSLIVSGRTSQDIRGRASRSPLPRDTSKFRPLNPTTTE